jgi:hypothetical protein
MTTICLIHNIETDQITSSNSEDRRRCRLCYKELRERRNQKWRQRQGERKKNKKNSNSHIVHTQILSQLRILPHTAEGDQEFLRIVELLPSWRENVTIHIRTEIEKRPSIHEGLTRLIWKHIQEPELGDRRRGGRTPPSV